jgi:hypothetical protein
MNKFLLLEDQLIGGLFETAHAEYSLLFYTTTSFLA